MLGLPLIGLLIALAPYSGPALPGSLSSSAKFAVGVTGMAGQTVALRTVDVPAGYIASFCTDRVCAPFAVTLTLPRSGHAQIELALVKNEPGAGKPRSVRVVANGRFSASIQYSRATH